jgi:hypothetical protein
MSKFLDEIIGYQIEETADWRRGKAQQFPEDSRNLIAAGELDRLAAEIHALDEGSEIEQQIDGRMTKLIELTNDPGHDDISPELRLIGFGATYSTGLEFLEWYRDMLQQQIQRQEAAAAAEAAEEMAHEAADETAKEAAEEAAKEAYDEAYKETYAEVYKEEYDEAYKEAYEEALTA